MPPMIIRRSNSARFAEPSSTSAASAWSMNWSCLPLPSVATLLVGVREVAMCAPSAEDDVEGDGRGDHATTEDGGRLVPAEVALLALRPAQLLRGLRPHQALQLRHGLGLRDQRDEDRDHGVG